MTFDTFDIWQRRGAKVIFPAVWDTHFTTLFLKTGHYCPPSPSSHTMHDAYSGADPGSYGGGGAVSWEWATPENFENMDCVMR